MDFSPRTLFIDAPQTAWYHIKNGNVNLIMTVFSLSMHVLTILGFYEARKAKAETLLFAFLLWPLTGFGITVGAHRLWSHRSYEAHISVRIVLMLLNSMANQTSIYHWSRDHRVHHKHSETTADPHNATRGFFFAHIGWLWLNKDKDVIKAGKEMDFSDLLDDPVVAFQQKCDPWFQQYMCFILPAQICKYCWGESFYLGFLIAGCTRYIWVKHCTFLVNSAAHLYGDHPYDVQSYPGENPIVSWFAIGEGWHNWHHKYPFDYAASEFGISAQYNPSKLVIDILAAGGLVWNRKRGDVAWTRGRARRDREAAEGILPKKLERPVDTVKVAKAE